MKHIACLRSWVLVAAAMPLSAAPITFSECPAVGLDTNGCELLITVTAVSNSGMATAFTVTTSDPDLGPFNGSDATLIGVLNASSRSVSKIVFTVAPGAGAFAFNRHGACLGTGSPVASAYSPGPTAAECLNGQYWTTDAMDYASASVTFCGFNLAAACVLVGEPAGVLAPGGTSWFSLPGALTAGQISVVTPEPVPASLIAAGLSAVCFRRRRRL
jgi:hypothetical protein